MDELMSAWEVSWEDWEYPMGGNGPVLMITRKHICSTFPYACSFARYLWESWSFKCHLSAVA